MFKKTNRNMQTKFRIIETPDYWLAVSDDEIKKGNWVIFLDKKLLYNVEYNSQLFDYNNDTNCKKIIAYQPKHKHAPKFNLPLLPEIVVEDDVEKLAETKAETHLEKIKDTARRWFWKKGFKVGYKAATKVSRKEEPISFYLWATKKYGSVKPVEEGCIVEKTDYKGLFHIYIQSLKQPKTPKWFVAEYKTEYTEDGLDYQSDELKTTVINGKTYLVGTYLYE
jgi:hypothetical protein